MAKHHYGWMIALAACVSLYVFSAGVAQAAGEWEWTKEQGWMMGAGVSRPTPKEQLQYAYELEQKGDYMDSARQYFLLVQNFPASDEAGVGLQRLARCLFEMENYYTSYKAIEQVIETYPNTGRMSDLVQIELRIAKKLLVSQTPDILSGRESNTRDFNVRRAIEILKSVIEHDPYGPYAAEAYLVKGEAHTFINEIQAARKAFETIRDEFPRSDFIERARLGILTCDRLMGQATDNEVKEQMDIVREAERERTQRMRDAEDGVDEVEESFRHLQEVEAAKMMEQAKQYRQMGTRKSVEAAKFLYGEIVRRYPGTTQADEAMGLLGNIKTPKEPSRIIKTFKDININPFTFNRDPEPPWIVPQMKPEDMVMVDKGLGPIAGVPETGGMPRTAAAASVRPMALGSGDDGAAVEQANFSPAPSAVSTPAPTFIDGVPTRDYSQVPTNLALGPTSTYGQPGGTLGAPPSYSTPYQQSAPSPLPGVSESDLIGGGGYQGSAATYQATPVYQATPTYQSPANYQTPGTVYSTTSAPIPDLAPVYGQSAPNLGSPLYNTPDSDLVGVAPRAPVGSAPIPDYTGGYGAGGYAQDSYGTASYITSDPQPGSYYAQPVQTGGYYAQPAPTYQDPMHQQPAPGYAVPGSLQPSQSYSGSGNSNGGWTFGDDFR